jgi:hypothetical protein
MNKFVTIGLAAAAVVVAAFLGYRLLIEPNVGGPPPIPSPSPSPSAEASPTSESTPMSFDDFAGGALSPGSYVLSGVEPFQITFTVPSGWEKLAVPAMVWSREDDKSTVGYFTVDDLVSDPCDPSQGYVGLGPSADDLATALGAMPGYELNLSAETTISGFAATMLDVQWGDPPCAEGVEAQLGISQPGDVVRPHPGAGEQLFSRWYIVDVDGERLVIATTAHANATQNRVDDIQEILRSTQVE